MYMKQCFFCVVMLLWVACGYAQSMEMDDYNALSQEDRELLTKATEMVDMGLTEAVIPDFDYLAKKYPDNYLVQYERLYNLYLLGRYDEVIKEEKKLRSLKNSDVLMYLILGNSYDNTGNSKKAEEIYREGLRYYPDSGQLLMEIGTLYLQEGDYNTALEYYNHGIVAQPNFASNYYRAAPLYMASENDKVWGLVYAESAILLDTANDDRHEEMSQMIANCLKENIHFSYEGEHALSVSLVSHRNMSVNQDNNVVYLSFPGIYEGAICQPLNSMLTEDIPFTGNLQQLIFIRKGLVDTYFSVTNNLYGNSMYLLEFQKQVIEAGHWDAYNYYLFMPAFPEEFHEWYASNSDKFEAFVNWYNTSPYQLGEGRSVDPEQIYNSYRPINMIESIIIQGKLLSDTPAGTAEE